MLYPEITAVCCEVRSCPRTIVTPQLKQFHQILRAQFHCGSCFDCNYCPRRQIFAKRSSAISRCLSQAEQDPWKNVDIPQSPLASECLVISLTDHTIRKPKDNPTLSLKVSLNTVSLGTEGSGVCGQRHRPAPRARAPAVQSCAISSHLAHLFHARCTRDASPAQTRGLESATRQAATLWQNRTASLDFQVLGEKFCHLLVKKKKKKLTRK